MWSFNALIVAVGLPTIWLFIGPAILRRARNNIPPQNRAFIGQWLTRHKGRGR